MITFFIDGIEVAGSPNETVLEVATRYGIEIPTLCHSEKIKEFGACGLCVVEAEGSPKLLRACATAIAENMKVNTRTDRVLSARRTALQLLMSDHEGDCIAPCQEACPAETDCQAYVGLIANGAFAESLKTIKDKLPLPASIGRVCPHPCETACRRKHFEDPVSIAHLKSFVADVDLNGDSFIPEMLADSGKSVAIIGGGPAGLSAAYFLRQKGHQVTILDAMPHMGGMLRYGIPQYRLPKEVLQREIDLIEKMDVTLRCGVKIPEDITLETLQKDYDAVLVTVGAWVSAPMRVQGEELAGVYGGIDFLRSVISEEPFEIGKNVAVCGGGNTAMDACRTAVRLGAENVYIVYRRTKNEMPADAIEIKEAEEEGITFKYLTNPSEIIGSDGRVSAIRLQKMELGEADASGRRRPVPTDEYETLQVDSVIMALGQKADLTGFDILGQSEWGTILADEDSFTTNVPGVFAAGDVTNQGAGIAIAAIAEARSAAFAIDAYLEGAELDYRAPVLSRRVVESKEDLLPVEAVQRVSMPHLSPAERRSNFQEVNLGFSREEAMREAARCLECGCMDYFECKLVGYANKYHIDMAHIQGRNHKRMTVDPHPYIIRNEDKCILCGQCVRICSEVVGKTALGFVGRGFDTMVKPAMDAPLEETDCIACGQCVSVCPTGALIERQAMKKPIPLPETRTRTTCGLCSVGCQMDAVTHDSLLLRVLPTSKADSFGNGLLCKRGRFEFMELYKYNRLKAPLLKTAAGMEETDLDTAVAAVKKAAAGSGKKAVLIGVDLTDTATDRAVAFAKSIGAEIYAVPRADELNVPFWLETSGARLLTGASSRYLADLDIPRYAGTDAEAVFIFGAAVPEDLKADFTAVTALYAEGGAGADVVLPGAAFLEESGSFTNYSGVKGAVNPALVPVAGHTNAELIEKLM